MAVFIIGFEGRGSRPYDRLQDAIDADGGVRIMDGLWALECDRDAPELRDWVHGFMDDEDAIVVIQVGSSNHWASRHLKSSVNDWLKTHV